MVNIQSIVCISPFSTIVFNSFNEYWVAMKRSHTNNATKLERLLKRKKLADTYEEALALKLEVDKTVVENIVTVFGTVREANRRLSDPYTREILFDLNNRVVVIAKDDGRMAQVIATVHMGEDYENIISTIREAKPPLIPQIEP